jgi:hypothetical protein
MINWKVDGFEENRCQEYKTATGNGKDTGAKLRNEKEIELSSTHVASDKLEFHIHVVKSDKFFPVQVLPYRKLFNPVASGASVHDDFLVILFQNKVSHIAHDPPTKVKHNNRYKN